MYRIQLKNIVDEDGMEVSDIVLTHRIPSQGDRVTSNYGELAIESVTLLGWDDEAREILSVSPNEVVAICCTAPPTDL